MSKSFSVKEFTTASKTTTTMDNSESSALSTSQNITLTRNNYDAELYENDVFTSFGKNSETTNSNQQPSQSSTDQQNTEETGETDDENSRRLLLAISLYHKAAKLEQQGKVYDAISFYRKAIHIEPNIEFKYYESHKNKSNYSQNANDCYGPSPSLIAKAREGILSRMDMKLYRKFQNDIYSNYNGRLIQSDRSSNVICTQTTHISDLPSELIANILSFVVSSHLDMRSLEQCAAVSKGLYVCARDQKLWRKACQKIWKNDLGTLSEENPVTINTLENCRIDKDNGNKVESQDIYTSWRQMFIDRAKVFFNGCYVGQTKYIRLGENSFQDQFYRPLQVVEYYRYLRFRADGSCYMLTTTESFRQSVARLENINQLKSDVIRGQYHIEGNTVSLVFTKAQNYRNLYRKTNSKSNSSTNNLIYYLQFRIQSVSTRKFSKLTWLKYSMTHNTGKRETTSDLNVASSRYPPLWFSVVRSYNAHSEGPLD